MRSVLPPRPQLWLGPSVLQAASGVKAATLRAT